MATTVTATRRFTITYVVSLVTHRQRAYAVPGPLTGGLTTVYKRDAVTLINCSVAAQGMWDATRQLLNATVAAASALVEDWTGTVWVPVDSFALTGVGASSVATKITSQATLTLRDTAFDKIRVQVMEHVDGYVGHSPNGLGIATETDAWVPFYTSAVYGAGAPYEWQVSRGSNYILASGAVAGLTLDQNQKLKRRRSVE